MTQDSISAGRTTNEAGSAADSDHEHRSGHRGSETGAAADSDHFAPVGPGGPGVRTRPLGSKWPSGDLRWPALTPSGFPRRFWEPQLYATVVLAQFAKLDWEAAVDVKHWEDHYADASFNYNSLDEELAGLAQIGSFQDQQAMLAEIQEQAGNMQSYWQGLLMFHQGSHPATYDLMHIAFKVGQMVVMHFKHKFNRPRPSQVSPNILPMIESPGHPAYPSGHALEGHLLSRCLSEAVPDARFALDALAARVAVNREIAGLHYPSDTHAGKLAAAACFTMLGRCPMFLEVVEAARKEW